MGKHSQPEELEEPASSAPAFLAGQPPPKQPPPKPPPPKPPPPKPPPPKPPPPKPPLKPPGTGTALPKWFALRGPEPGWVARNWSFILAVVSAVVLLLNMMLSQQLVGAHLYNEVTTIVAWLSPAALFLQSRQSKVEAVAAWRAQIRAEEAAKPGTG